MPGQDPTSSTQFRVPKMAPKSAEQAGLKTPLIAKVEATAVNPVAATAASSTPTKAVPFTALYRYASYLDVVAMVIALISSLINGAAFPLLGILFGNLLNALQGARSGLRTGLLSIEQVAFLPSSQAPISSRKSTSMHSIFSSSRSAAASRLCWRRCSLSSSLLARCQRSGQSVSSRDALDLFRARVQTLFGLGPTPSLLSNLRCLP